MAQSSACSAAANTQPDADPAGAFHSVSRLGHLRSQFSEHVLQCAFPDLGCIGEQITQLLDFFLGG
jgi:hypothetical protein